VIWGKNVHIDVVPKVLAILRDRVHQSFSIIILLYIDLLVNRSNFRVIPVKLPRATCKSGIPHRESTRIFFSKLTVNSASIVLEINSAIEPRGVILNKPSTNNILIREMLDPS
jgi:hypothetical protein